ncbi:MAG TPA: RNA-guided endonuclease TnpB family protein [Methylomusa anaerophila]|uniref:Putative transposase n=1 Tax=Methylomusa anaerophila TaxID=1930071 RepID=A0A348AGG1_9FIRM|nr:RNA-guided endonuclease TnpB family protein [Methylomusa anaerophila]BBB90159.1 putative transposase [Methylomusa anaerophila]HML88115.1 RNA-guided endonuclease TnpB family protein [Methylomusa anaerophila]
MNKAYKYRLYPDPEQKNLINKTFGCVRFVYNKMLANRKEIYEQFKDDKEALKAQKYLLPADFKKEFEWLKEVDSLALANAQLNLQTAYKNFFRDKIIGFPKFKSKHHSRKSYTTNNQGGTIRLVDNKTIRLPKLKDVRIKLHRQMPLQAAIKSATISKTPTGKYYIAILVEYETKIKPVTPKPETVLGLDYSSKSLFVDSQANNADYPKFYRKAEEKLRKAQRKLSKRKKEGKNREKQRRKVAKLHEKVANQRKDFLHKLSRQIANVYTAIAIEELNMRGMAQSLNLAKSTNDNGFGMLKTFLTYKLAEQGKQLVVIDKWFPSSKKCSFCGNENKELTLADRAWTCSHCGAELDRDINAAINIKNEGCRILNIA